MKSKLTPQQNSFAQRVFLKALIVALGAAILGMFGPVWLGEWIMSALGLVIIASLALLLTMPW